LTGEEGNDVIEGGDGNDLLAGGDGNDTLRRDAGKDVVFGGLDDDELHGGLGSDVLFGDEGDDSLFGDEGSDTLHGGAGNDWLFGGLDSAVDSYFGEAGADSFLSTSSASTSTSCGDYPNGKMASSGRKDAALGPLPTPGAWTCGSSSLVFGLLFLWFSSGRGLLSGSVGKSGQIRGEHRDGVAIVGHGRPIPQIEAFFDWLNACRLLFGDGSANMNIQLDLPYLQAIP
jgi:hypothetical protein